MLIFKNLQRFTSQGKIDQQFTGTNKSWKNNINLKKKPINLHFWHYVFFFYSSIRKILNNPLISISNNATWNLAEISIKLCCQLTTWLKKTKRKRSTSTFAWVLRKISKKFSKSKHHCQIISNTDFLNMENYNEVETISWHRPWDDRCMHDVLKILAYNVCTCYTVWINKI